MPRHKLDIKKITHEQINKSIKDYRDTLEKLIEELKSKSKPLEELVFSETFLVREVISQSYRGSFTPESEFRTGPGLQVYETGQSCQLKLTVTHPRRMLPVHILNFDGNSPVLADYYITVKIPRYEERSLDHPTSKGPFFENLSQTISRKIYLDRAYQKEESAIEIAILSPAGKFLRIDRATDYGRFVISKSS